MFNENYKKGQNMNKPIFIFDLDNTVIDSKHRVPLTPSGNLHLSRYKRESTTRSKIFKDTEMTNKLAQFMRLLIKKNSCNVWICTAREMTQADFDYLEEKGLKPKVILSRPINDNRPDNLLKKALLNKMFNLKPYKDSAKYMFEDSMLVAQEIKLLGVKMLSPDYMRLK